MTYKVTNLALGVNNAILIKNCLNFSQHFPFQFKKIKVLVKNVISFVMQ